MTKQAALRQPILVIFKRSAVVRTTENPQEKEEEVQKVEIQRESADDAQLGERLFVDVRSILSLS